MPTMEDLVEKTRSKVRGSVPEALNVLDQPYDAGSGAVVLRLPGTVKPGQMFSAGLNTFYVMTADASAQNLTVLASADGSLDQDLPALTRCHIKPAHTTWSIFRELHDEIVSMSSPRSGIYQPVAFTSIVNWSHSTYDLPEDWQEDLLQPMKLLRSRWKDMAYDRWYDWDGAEWQPERWQVQVEGYPPYASQIEFTFAFPFRPPQSLADDITLLGLTEKTTQDIPTLGAAAMLLGSADGRRLNPSAQGDPRRAEEVPPGGSSSLATMWLRQKRERIAEEKSRLQNLFPYRRAMGMHG